MNSIKLEIIKNYKNIEIKNEIIHLFVTIIVSVFYASYF